MSHNDEHSAVTGGKDAERWPGVTLQHLRRLVGSSPSEQPVWLTFSSSVAYVYVCRHFQISRLADASIEEAAGIKEILSSIAHFVTDRKSQVLHTSLSAIVTDIWSRLGEVSGLTAPPAPVY